MENASLGAIFREFWVNYMAKLRPACPCSQGKLQIFPNMKKTAIFRDQLAMISWRTSGPVKILNCAVNKKRVALQICAWPFKVKLIDFGGGQKRVVRRRPGTSWNMLCGDKMVWPKKRAVWPFCSSGDLLKIDAISSWNTAAKRKKFVRRLLTGASWNAVNLAANKKMCSWTWIFGILGDGWTLAMFSCRPTVPKTTATSDPQGLYSHIQAFLLKLCALFLWERRIRRFF